MKISVIKQPGGILIPASDLEAEKLVKFKTGSVYDIDIKLCRNPKFHGKVFAFFNYCYEVWDGDKVMENGTPEAQFTRFRNDLTILAGYYHQTVRLNGDVRLEAKSLSYGSMEEEEFQQCYQALISAAMRHLFKTETDEEVYNKLVGFF